MGKKKAVSVEEKAEAAVAKRADGALPWVEPFPESKPDGKGQETVFVLARVNQDLILNGVKFQAGREHVLGADVAHAHGAILSAPK